MLNDAPSLEAVLTAFRQFIQDYPLCFHNASFDWRMLNTKYKPLGWQLSNEVLCTQRLFRYLHPECHASNLEYVTGYYGKPIEGHHRASVDCKWTAACYRKMREEILVKNPPVWTTDSNSSNCAVRKELTYMQLEKEGIVRRVAGWKKGRKSRIYCTTNFADFFYDLTDQVWRVVRNKTGMNVNVTDLSRFVLTKLGMDQNEFVQQYRDSRVTF